MLTLLLALCAVATLVCFYRTLDAPNMRLPVYWLGCSYLFAVGSIISGVLGLT